MSLRFPEVEKAIHFTLTFYEIDRIKEYMFKFANQKPLIKVINNSTDKSEWHDTVLGFQDNMDKEIEQHMGYSNGVALAYLFDTLNSWVAYYLFESVWLPTLGHAIHDYNTTVYEDFILKQEKEEEKFKESENYKKYNHLDKIVDTIPKEFHKLNFDVTYDTGHVYHKFLVAHCPPLIDSSPPVLDKYIDLVRMLIENFKRIVAKHFAIYNLVKLTPQFTQIQAGLPAMQEQPQITQPPELISKKLIVNISVPQLAYLFFMLHELNPDIFDLKSKTELYKFVTDNFVTKGTKETGISFDSFKNDFTKQTDKTVEYWIEKLKKMLENSRKKLS